MFIVEDENDLIDVQLIETEMFEKSLSRGNGC